MCRLSFRLALLVRLHTLGVFCFPAAGALGSSYVLASRVVGVLQRERDSLPRDSRRSTTSGRRSGQLRRFGVLECEMLLYSRLFMCVGCYLVDKQTFVLLVTVHVHCAPNRWKYMVAQRRGRFPSAVLDVYESGAQGRLGLRSSERNVATLQLSGWHASPLSLTLSLSSSSLDTLNPPWVTMNHEA